MRLVDVCVKRLTILAFMASIAVVVSSAGLAEAGHFSFFSRFFSCPCFGSLVGASSGFLPDHYDQRTGDFDPNSAGVFDDGADVVLTGWISKFGPATVEASAAWDWGTYLTNHPSALVYNMPITMPKQHQHAGCKSGDSVIANTHTFNATVKITNKDGHEIYADILGGMNNERLIFGVGGHDPICEDLSDFIPNGAGSAYDSSHNETENEVLINFMITGGTGKFSGATGNGVLQFVYDTMEPHNLLEAAIILNLD